MKTFLVSFLICLPLFVYSQVPIEYMVQRQRMPLRDHPQGKVLVKVPRNNSLTILSFHENCHCFRASYLGVQGFLPSAVLLNDIYPKTFRRSGSIDTLNAELRRLFTEQQLVVERTSDGTFVLDRKITESAEYAQKRSALIRKYGYTNGTKVAEGEVWLGMTTDMTLDSWGIPYRVNRSHGNWGKQEQWIYSEGYLYFENGLLTEILRINARD